MGRLFGTDGVRGSANKDLTPELVFSLGKSASLVIAQRHGKGKAKAVVGRDPRASGEMLEAALIAGLATVGVDVLYYSANTNGGKVIELYGLTTPNMGDYVRIPWSSPYFEQDLGYAQPIEEFSGTPLNSLFYRITSGTSTPNQYILDREIPDFNGVYTSSSGKSTYVAFYPSAPIESFYGSGTTVDPKLWNFNIVRTSSVPGTTSGISGYTSYGSIQYNGTKQYLGFSAETPAFGILHYTNNFTGNTYAEQLLEKTIEVD